jgi:hypothetical protein
MPEGRCTVKKPRKVPLSRGFQSVIVMAVMSSAPVALARAASCAVDTVLWVKR